VYGYETWYMTENIQGKEDSDEDVWTSNWGKCLENHN
jgi:hypothetical protein